MKWFTKCIKNYAVFKGRAVRPEFWYFALASAIIQISLFTIDIIIGWDIGSVNGFPVLPLLETSRLFLLVPIISVTVRTNLYESIIAKNLSIIQTKYKDHDIGSYPRFDLKKKTGFVNIVISGTNSKKIILIKKEVILSIKKLGGEIE